MNLVSTSALAAVLLMGRLAQAGDPLPSWNDGSAKRAITDFVVKVTTNFP